jgi:hypothetical protein
MYARWLGDRIRDVQVISQFGPFSVTMRQLPRRKIETPIRKLEERFKEIPEREFLQNAGNTGCDDDRSNEMQID